MHEGHDVMYTMDDLDRLIDADEGTRSGSSITSRTRHQTWLHSSTSQLSHTGNWTRSKLDINGDDDWSDTDEYDDSRTHNAVNELTARDVDSDATDDYTLSYDAAGDLTDDGEDYKYEYDAFYRLCKVRDQSDTLVAEYRYNGLGHMIGVHEDTDGDGDADGSDVWFYPVYDEIWREVARYRESDSSPKEQFVNACAGPGGYGRASYINDIVCRDRDANSGWTSASDGTLEERYYYCPNWRGDVSVLVTSGAQLHERPKYSPYGIPNASPGADLDSDGDCDATDATIVQSWIDTSHYDIRGDIDLDGDVDSTDKSIAAGTVYGTTLGWGTPTSATIGNNRGHQGGISLPGLAILLRNRAWRTDLGEWAARDPAGYNDGANLYAFGSLKPLLERDPLGLTSIGPASTFCGRTFGLTPGHAAPSPGGGSGAGTAELFKCVDCLQDCCRPVQSDSVSSPEAKAAAKELCDAIRVVLGSRTPRGWTSRLYPPGAVLDGNGDPARGYTGVYHNNQDEIGGGEIGFEEDGKSTSNNNHDGEVMCHELGHAAAYENGYRQGKGYSEVHSREKDDSPTAEAYKRGKRMWDVCKGRCETECRW